MARHEENLCLCFAKSHPVAFAHLQIDARNSRSIIGRSDDPAARGLLDLQIAPYMVAMMMGVEDVSDAPAQALRLLQNRRGDRRIDHRSLAGLRAVRQVDVVVAEDRTLLNLQPAHGV